MVSNREKKNVWIIPGWFPGTLSEHTGDFVWNQVRDLGKRDTHCYTIIYPELSYRFVSKPAFYWPQVSHERKEGVDIIRLTGLALPRPGFGFFLAWRQRVMRFLDSVANKNSRPDLIHAHTFLGGFLAAAFSRKHDVPVVLTEHSDVILTDIPKRYQPVIQAAYQQCDRIITASSFLRDAVLKICPKANCAVIPLSIDQNLFYGSIEEQPGKVDTLKLITVCELVPVKNLDFLIGVAYELKQMDIPFELHIVGDGPEKGDLLKQIQEKGLNDNVCVAGWKTPPQVADLMRASHVYVCSSIRETFGLSVLEAIHCGLAVVTTPCGGPRDFANYCEQFYEAQNMGAFVEQLKMLYKEMQGGSYLRPRMSDRNSFSAESVSMQIEKVYDELNPRT